MTEPLGAAGARLTAARRVATNRGMEHESCAAFVVVASNTPSRPPSHQLAPPLPAALLVAGALTAVPAGGKQPPAFELRTLGVLGWRQTSTRDTWAFRYADRNFGDALPIDALRPLLGRHVV